VRHRVHAHDDVVFALPDPGSVDCAEVQVALSLRNQATLISVCPVCGARSPHRPERRRLSRERRSQVFEIVFLYEPECPCGDDRLRDLLREVGDAA
jgi:hypothetical protein